MGYLKEKTHVSWVITAICLGFLTGVAVVRWFPGIDKYSLWLLGFGVVLSLVSLISRWRLIVVVAVLGGLVLGIVRSSGLPAGIDRYSDLVGDEVIVQGTVADDPAMSRGSMTINLDQPILTLGKRRYDLGGRIWASIKGGQSAELLRYDRVKLSGTLDSGFGSYVATLPRARLVEVAHPAGADPMGRVREHFADGLKKVMSRENADLGMGILTGQKANLNERIKNAFMLASLTHVLVASGYNLTVLVRFARRLLAKRSRLVAVVLSVTLVLLFTQLTGPSASMDRAVLVSIYSLLLWYVGRKSHPVTLLAIVATVTIMLDPSQLWGDVSWYLSFGSFAGVIILAPLLHDLIKVKWSLVQILLETVSAQLVTWPIIAVAMGKVSLVGLVTNLLVLPMLPLAMLATFVAGLSTFLLPSAGAGIVALPANALLDWVKAVAGWGSTLPGAGLEYRPDLKIAGVYYLVMVAVILVLKRLTKHNFYGDNVIE